MSSFRGTVCQRQKRNPSITDVAIGPIWGGLDGLNLHERIGAFVIVAITRTCTTWYEQRFGDASGEPEQPERVVQTLFLLEEAKLPLGHLVGQLHFVVLVLLVVDAVQQFQFRLTHEVRRFRVADVAAHRYRLEHVEAEQLVA